MDKTFTDLLKQAKIKYQQIDSNNNRNCLNESYQQFDFLNVKGFIQKLIAGMQVISKKSQVKTKAFNIILQNVGKYAASLLSLANGIAEFLEVENKITLNHQHYNSQSLMLGLYLKYFYLNKNVLIVTTQENVKQWQKYFVSQSSSDPEADLQKFIVQQNIKVHYFEQSYRKPLQKSDQIVIVDLFNVDETKYRPYLLSRRSEFNIPEKVILYHSHNQVKEMSLNLQHLLQQFEQTEACLTYPIEIQYTPKQADVKDNLVKLLKEDSNHPQKQDIVIFYRNQHLANSNVKRYSSKLKELLSQEKLLSHVHIITQPNEPLVTGKNYIFIVDNFQQLSAWNYNYQNVFYIIDYGWNTFYKMDHKYSCCVQGLKKQDLREKSKRMSLIGTSKVGKYVYIESEVSQSNSYLQEARQIVTYCLRMIDLKLYPYLQILNSRVKECLDNLVKHKSLSLKQNNSYQLKDSSVMEFIKHGIDPIHVEMIKSAIAREEKLQKKQLTNAVIMAICIISNRGNLKQNKDNLSAKSIIKPTGVWRRSGYLHSCLEIITKSQIIQTKKNKNSRSATISRRKTSKMNENEYDVYGSLFQVIAPKKMEFQDMQMEDLIREYSVNDTILSQIRDRVDEIRDVFNIEQTNINIDSSFVTQVMQIITEVSGNSVSHFSGSRRNGYMLKSQNKNIFANKQSLIAQLNETPQFLLILRFFQSEQGRQILMCNHYSIDSYMSVFGDLPQKRLDSLGQFEVQFHGISSSVFKGLSRNNNSELKKFQTENKCFIEPNQQMATITIYCSKQNGESIKALFDDLIVKIKDKYVNYNKIIHYLGNTNIVMSNGGQVKQVIKDKYISSCYLNNLDLEVTVEDLQELFDQFFVLKDIEMLAPKANKFSKSAIIHFNCQKDFYRFHSYYNECKYLDRNLEVKAIVQEKVHSAKEQIYIDFKWYVWKSHKKALVEFVKEEVAEKAYKFFTDNPTFDGKKVIVTLNKNKQVYRYFRILIDDLNEKVDEITLEKDFTAYGQIKQVEILKTPLKQPLNQEHTLQSLIKDTLNIKQIDNKFTIHPIQKHKNGLRTCKVSIKQMADLKTLIGQLNAVKNKMGQGRLYAQSWFSKPILIAYPGSLQLYQDLLEQVIKQAPQKPNIHSYLQDMSNKKLYLFLKSPLDQTLEYISTKFQQKLVPHNIDLTELQKNIIISDIGFQNLVDLEDKFNCKLIVNSLKKTLSVICKFQNLKRIKEQITAKVEQNFFYRITLNSKSFKNMSNDKVKLEQLKKTYHLSILELQEFSKTLIFQGSALHVQNALNYMMHLIQSYSVPEQELVNTDVCLICYQQPFRPYRLQNCGHKFCFGCLDQCINSTLGDASMFPIKCPHCMIEVTIDDLQTLVDTAGWAKLINMACNQFVGKNGQSLTFCYTPGCKQINVLNLTHYRCDSCQASYCCECKLRWHQGLTCQQAKMGGDSLFKKYMQQNGVRQCPNKACKMPIIRTDGCFRVTCSRCNKSMCFKCEPKKMIAYDNYNDCYKHLNDVHGGYW